MQSKNKTRQNTKCSDFTFQRQFKIEAPLSKTMADSPGLEWLRKVSTCVCLQHWAALLLMISKKKKKLIGVYSCRSFHEFRMFWEGTGHMAQAAVSFLLTIWPQNWSAINMQGADAGQYSPKRQKDSNTTFMMCKSGGHLYLIRDIMSLL